MQISAPPEETGFLESAFALTNGVIGLRACLPWGEPDRDPGCFVAGIYEHAPGRRLARLPVCRHPRIRAGTRWSDGKLNRSGFQRVLDYRTATLHTSAAYESPSGSAILHTETRIPYGHGPVVIVTGRVAEAPGDGPAYVEWGLEWSRTVGDDTPPGALVTEKVRLDGATLELSGHLVRVGRRLRVIVHCVGAKPGDVALVRHADTAVLSWAFATAPAEFALVTEYCFDDEPSRVNPVDLARIQRSHEDHWTEVWERADVEIDGDPELTALLRYGIFQLEQSAGFPANCPNIPARGLTSDYHGGHFFFNTELFMVPYYTATIPERARELLRFRIHTLRAASRHAQARGHTGAFYPMETDGTGDDASACPVAQLRERTHAARRKVFLSAVVAHAFLRFHEVTGDTGLLDDGGLDVLREVAKFAVSILDERPEGYTALNVMGPDEYHHVVDSNAFTDLLLRRVLLGTARLHRPPRPRPTGCEVAVSPDIDADAGIDDVSRWTEIGNAVRPPVVSLDGVIEQFAGYFELPDAFVATDRLGRPVLDGEQRSVAAGAACDTKLIKEADVLLLAAIAPQCVTAEQQAASLDFYAARTAYQSSLSYAPYGIVAGRVGRPDQAREYMFKSAAFDLLLQDRHGYRNGVHLAAYAGAWQVLVFGILNVDPGSRLLRMSPVLPRGWRRCCLSLTWDGCPLRIVVSDDSLSLRRSAGGPDRAIRARVWTQETSLEPSATVVIPRPSEPTNEQRGR